jgi:hypothetical protein
MNKGLYYKVPSMIWNLFQGYLALQLWAFFFMPDSKGLDGKEIVWIFWHPVPAEGVVMNILGLQWELATIIGALAIIYVIVGFLQAAYLPRTSDWTRGANWAFSFFVFFAVLFAYLRIIFDESFSLTLFQHQILIFFLFATIMDLLMDFLLPRIGGLMGRAVTASKPTP